MANRKSNQSVVDPRLIKMLESRSRGSRTYFVGTLMGISVGAIVCISGFVLCILGLSGTIEWIFEAADFKSRISNASPGVFFALLGAIILWRYKPKVTDRLRMGPDTLSSSQSFDNGSREPRIDVESCRSFLDIRHDMTE